MENKDKTPKVEETPKVDMQQHVAKIMSTPEQEEGTSETYEQKKKRLKELKEETEKNSKIGSLIVEK